MLNSSAGSVFQSIGNTKLLFINSCINTLITVIGILIGIFVGKSIYVLSLCVAIAYICHFLTAFYMLIKMGFKVKISGFVKDLIPEIFMLALMILGVALYPFHFENVFLSFGVKFVYLGLVFVIGLIVSKEYKLFVSIIKQ